LKQSAGFRALPPIDRPALTIMMYDPDTEADLYAVMLGDPGSAAVVRFNIIGRDFLNFWDRGHGGPWDLPAGRIPEFNSFLRGSIAIVGRRDGAVENVPVKSQVSARLA
jgi:hypothetical protein